MIFDCCESSLVTQHLLVLAFSGYLTQCHDGCSPTGYVDRDRPFRSRRKIRVNECLHAFTYIHIQAQRASRAILLDCLVRFLLFLSKNNLVRSSSGIYISCDSNKLLQFLMNLTRLCSSWAWGKIPLSFFIEESCLNSMISWTSFDSFMFLVFHDHQGRFFSSCKSDKVLFSFLPKRISPGLSV